MTTTATTGPDQNLYSFAGQPFPTAETIPDDSLSFLKQYTGLQDADALRNRVAQVWTISLEKLHVYKCIHQLSFLRPRVIHDPAYQKALQLVAASSSPHVMDVGCCYGTDLRAYILNAGLAPEILTASDVHDGYWQLGKLLFDDADRIAGVTAVFGDMATENTDDLSQSIASSSSFPTETSPKTNSPSRALLPTIFQPLPPQTVLSATLVLHVFSLPQTAAFVRNAYRLLAPGGLFFGSCVGAAREGQWRTVKGVAPDTAIDYAKPPTSPSDPLVEPPPPSDQIPRYLHSQSSLTHLLTSSGFTNVSVSIRRFEGDLSDLNDLVKPAHEKTGRGEAAGGKVFLMFEAYRPES
ncbi:hypothetical protein DFS34DRAFT_596982 [Phlyctochytrium arcticum]|nr:hypothetical protein DFS34DRAFT_596982 [Phlyctochytrium arcticum]